MKKAGIITFHNTPNFGATLQCYALFKKIQQLNLNIEVINYMPLSSTWMYFRSLFLGQRRTWKNIGRTWAFLKFVRDELKMSGGPLFHRSQLRTLRDRYDVVFTGSDEVWKVSKSRRLDDAYYLDFANPETTRLAAYAASASARTNLLDYRDRVAPLLKRFDGLGVRDPETASMVHDLTGKPVEQVLDPTFLWDFNSENLPRIHDRPYIAIYHWLDQRGAISVRQFADKEGLDMICIGCHHKLADKNYVAIGPREWLAHVKHTDLLITDFFHGILFSLIFKRRLCAIVDEKKLLKIRNIFSLANIPWKKLRKNAHGLHNCEMADFELDHDAITSTLAPHIESSNAYLKTQIEALGTDNPDRS